MYRLLNRKYELIMKWKIDDMWMKNFILESWLKILLVLLWFLGVLKFLKIIKKLVEFFDLDFCYNYNII